MPSFPPHHHQQQGALVVLSRHDPEPTPLVWHRPLELPLEEPRQLWIALEYDHRKGGESPGIPQGEGRCSQEASKPWIQDEEERKRKRQFVRR